MSICHIQKHPKTWKSGKYKVREYLNVTTWANQQLSLLFYCPLWRALYLDKFAGPNWVWHCSTALLNPRPVYSCGWRCSKHHQLQSYTITIPYCPWHLGYGKRTTGQTDRNTGSWHQVRWASMHSRGSVFPLLRRIKGSVRFLGSLLFIMCSHQVLTDSQHVPQVPMCSSVCSHQWCPSQKEKEKKTWGLLTTI